VQTVDTMQVIDAINLQIIYEENRQQVTKSSVL